ncbi:hypothetical protein AAC387_Pa07g3329 [Persea americana]
MIEGEKRQGKVLPMDTKPAANSVVFTIFLVICSIHLSDSTLTMISWVRRLYCLHFGHMLSSIAPSGLTLTRQTEKGKSVV